MTSSGLLVRLDAAPVMIGRMVAGQRSALIVACDNYLDPGLRKLRAPTRDAEALAEVLRDPLVGDFDVRTSVNEPAYVVSETVEEFFADRGPEDLLLLHFSCHGVKDEGGELYFASANTKLGRLGATGVAADFVNRRMNRSRSRRIVLLLDCCYAGAFERGMTHRAGTGMNLEEQLSGRGRAVITASSAMEYSFESGQLADAADGGPSVFTGALVEGLSTGEADRNQDGLITLDELYEYVYARVRTTSPNQTPGKWMFGMQGELYIARRTRPLREPTPLPAELEQLTDSPLSSVRAAAVAELEKLVRGRHLGLAEAARAALRKLARDDSRTVSAAASAALRAEMPRPAPPFAAPDADPPRATPAPAPRPPAYSRPERTPAAPRPPVPGALPRIQRPSPAPHPVGRGDPVVLPRVAGALLICAAVLMGGNPFVPFGLDPHARLLSQGPASVAPALVLAALTACAGVALLGGRGSRSIGAGLALGQGVTMPWFLWNQWGPRTEWGPATWMWFAALIICVVATGLVAVTVFRTADVRLSFRMPTDAGSWTFVCLGVIALAFVPLLESAVDVAPNAPQHWGVVSIVVMSIAVPVCAAFALPRSFGAALLTGWCCAAGLVAYYAVRKPTPGNLDPEMIALFMTVLVGTAAAVVILTAPVWSAEVKRIYSAVLTRSRAAR